MPWHSTPVAIASLLFAGFLVWKYRPVGGFSTSVGLFGGTMRTGEDVRRARARVRLAKTPRERAALLIDAAVLASKDPRHITAATGYLLRATRADPAWPEPVLAMRRLLEKESPGALESALLRKLTQIPWSGETAAAARCAAIGLAALYRGALRDRDRATVMERLADFIDTSRP